MLNPILNGRKMGLLIGQKVCRSMYNPQNVSLLKKIRNQTISLRVNSCSHSPMLEEDQCMHTWTFLNWQVSPYESTQCFLPFIISSLFQSLRENDDKIEFRDTVMECPNVMPGWERLYLWAMQKPRRESSCFLLLFFASKTLPAKWRVFTWNSPTLSAFLKCVE